MVPALEHDEFASNTSENEREKRKQVDAHFDYSENSWVDVSSFLKSSYLLTLNVFTRNLLAFVASSIDNHTRALLDLASTEIWNTLHKYASQIQVQWFEKNWKIVSKPVRKDFLRRRVIKRACSRGATANLR